MAAALPMLSIVAVILAARLLETSWARRQIASFVHRAAGVDLDWRSLRLALASGLRVEGLAVRSPPTFRATEPDLLRAGLVEIDWSWASLRGGGPPIERILMRDVAVTVVEDAHGDSLSALAPPAAGPPAPAPPLSSQPARWLARTPPARTVDLAGATVTLVRLRDGAPSDRTVLELPPLHVRAERGTAGWGLALHTAAPNDVVVRRARPDRPTFEARAQVELSASIDPGAADLSLEVSSLRQSLELANPSPDRAGPSRRVVDARRGNEAYPPEHAAVDASPSSMGPRKPVGPDRPSGDGMGLIQGLFVPGVTRDRLLALSASSRFEPARGRTEIDLTRVALAGGAARGTARLDLPDAPDAPATVVAAALDADLAPVAAVAKAIGFDPGPLRGRLHGELRDLVLGPLPRLGPGGAVEASGALDAVAAGALSAHGARWSLRATPDAGKLTVVGSLDLERLRLDAPGRKATADGLVLRLDPARFDPGAPLSSPATIRLSVKAAGLDLETGALRVMGKGARVDLTATSPGRGPLAAGGTLQLSRLTVRAEAGRGLAGRRGGEALAAPPRPAVGPERERHPALLDGPVRLSLTLAKVEPVLAHPAASRGELHADLTAGPFHAAFGAGKGADDLDFTLSASAASLAAARAFQPAALSVPWERMGFSLTSAGRVEGLAAGPPRLRQRTELHVDRPALAGAGPAVAARALDLALVSDGTAQRQEARLDLRLRQLAVGTARPADGRIQAEITFDAGKPGLQARMRSSGGRWPVASLDATLGVDRARRALSYDGSVHLSRLASLAPTTPAIDLGPLDLSLSSRGLVRGILAGFGARGLPRLSEAPAPAIEGTLDARLTGLHFSSGDAEARLPALSFSGRFQGDGSRRRVDGSLTADAAHVSLGARSADLRSIVDRIEASEDGGGTLDLIDHLAVRTVRQRAVPEYPIGEVTVGLAAQIDRDRTVRLSRLSLENGAGGTSLELSGGLMLGAVQKKLALRGEIRQDLSRFSNTPEVASGEGTASVTFRVASPDLLLFQTAADVRLAGVSLSLPGRGIRVDTLDGEVPVNADFSAGEGGVQWLRGDADPYLRFPDQQPLLHRRSFVSARGLVTPEVSIAPIAGNLRIAQNIVSMSQMELGVRGGRIAGECTLDWEGRSSTLRLHVRANGVQSSHGEPFDGNAAVVVSGRDRSVDGHAEILKIGRRHLLDLLDLADPHRTNAAANRLRRDLALGYPDHVRLVFDHGFADAAVRFGGLAGLFKVGEMRGIPMEPLVDRLFASFSDNPEIVQ